MQPNACSEVASKIRYPHIRRSPGQIGGREDGLDIPGVGRDSGSRVVARKLSVPLAQVSEMAMAKDGGEEVRQSAWAKAQRIAQAELEALGWTAQDLQDRRKSDPQKVRIAARLRRETTMTLGWIAERLCMGAPTYVASLLQRHNQKGPNSGETLF